jgi:hypothetical protein
MDTDMSVENMLGGPIAEFSKIYRPPPGSIRPSIAWAPEHEREQFGKSDCFAPIAGPVLLRERDPANALARDEYVNPVCWCPKLNRHVGRLDGGAVVLLDEFGEPLDDPRGPTDWKRIALESYERLGCDYGLPYLILDVRSEEQVRYDSAVGAFPVLADQLGRPAERDWLFNAGPVVTAPKRWSSAQWWREKVEQTRLGFWGEHGEYSHTDVNDRELVYTLFLQPMSVRNSYSIDSGCGPIVSKYKLSATQQAELRGRGHSPHGWAERFAWIVADTDRTFCWVA